MCAWGILGSGAFGKVYRGTWNGTPVAIKQLQDQPGIDVAAGFKAEFESMVALRHPNIVMLLGVITEPLSIVMEFVEGQSLEQLIHKSGGYDQLPISRRLEILRQVAAGLTYIHDRKIIHGDMKPGMSAPHLHLMLQPTLCWTLPARSAWSTWVSPNFERRWR
eukprot:TRINITY_DN3535_c0_g1_i7.p1 TRINITY_DN3535_c0_g1~~TRINITY_DN3535_c0_g1_i7.p1  ORF type:complete len:163 (+),score=16.79 TRINITY_DN3535_c0_g1_i7:686-1174(+)